MSAHAAHAANWLLDIKRWGRGRTREKRKREWEWEREREREWGDKWAHQTPKYIWTSVSIQNTYALPFLLCDFTLAIKPSLERRVIYWYNALNHASPSLIAPIFISPSREVSAIHKKKNTVCHPYVISRLPTWLTNHRLRLRRGCVFATHCLHKSASLEFLITAKLWDHEPRM